MDEGLYSITLDYRGGTYIAQALARSPSEAVRVWLDSASEERLKEWDLKRDQLAEAFSDDKPTPLDGCVNAWCLSGIADNELALIHIIKTVKH